MLTSALEGKRIVICAGSGGVGKTTTAAALSLGLARRGARVAVVTIDPARRLSDALGLSGLGDEPHRVAGVEGPGELWAAVLDPKRTFDHLIERLAPDQCTRDEVFANRIYQQLTNAVAGSQEFSAVARLYELDERREFDVLVLDTPPSRNALDFLDAPGRLTRFFQGRAIRLFLRPAGLGGRILGKGTGVVFSVLRRVTGVDLLEDLSVFFRTLGGMIDGFTDRARHVAALLEDPATTFLIVTSPRHDPVQEAVFFRRKLAEAGMPFGGAVVNRVHEPAPEALPEEAAGELGADLAGRVVTAAREQAALAARDAAGIAQLEAELGGAAAAVVPELGDEVHDLDGLGRVETHLFDAPAPAPLPARA
jgi:anion-transporting  ArsA/GET3 family ATPase